MVLLLPNFTISNSLDYVVDNEVNSRYSDYRIVFFPDFLVLPQPVKKIEKDISNADTQFVIQTVF